MKFEIERKFLVDKSKWNAVEKSESAFLQQGYLSRDPEKTIRIRVTDTEGFVTIKGRTVVATRKEFEYAIPKPDAMELLNEFCDAVISKVRYRALYKGNVWEVDEFGGDNEGLIIAEIELNSEHQEFEIPDWVGTEVTGEEKYYNSNLSLHPYKTW
jgi:CYTH domain-containing protein